jgi:TPR repeat protein
MDQEEYVFEAVHWLRMCLDHCEHIPDAYFLLGYFYENGIQVDKSLIQAFKYYEKAADLGHVKATTKVGHMYYSGIARATDRAYTQDYFLEPDR